MVGCFGTLGDRNFLEEFGGMKNGWKKKQAYFRVLEATDPEIVKIKGWKFAVNEILKG
jgi:hypothetical protein